MLEPFMLLALAAAGLAISFYIYWWKKWNRVLVCPLGEDCNAVVRSAYGTTLGVSNEVFGMLYYLAVAVGAFAAVFVPRARGDIFVQGLLVASGLSVLFSLYLVFVQAFVLRQWCVWCVTTAVINVAIFILIFT